jgi:cell division protein FtsQ
LPRRWYVAAVAGVVMLGLALAAWILPLSDWAARAQAYGSAGLIAWSNQAGLTVRAITVGGRDAIGAETVLTAIGAQPGDPILAVDLAAARLRLEAVSWVAAATVERRLPDTVHVTIVERMPIARWQVDGRTVLIDAAGIVLSGVGVDADARRDLRRLVGAGAAANASALYDMLAREPALDARVVAAVRVRDRRWDIIFDNAVVAHLPEIDTVLAWARIAQLESEHRILARDIVALDLRLPNRLVVRLAPEAAAARRAPGKNT